jgi:AAA domain
MQCRVPSLVQHAPRTGPAIDRATISTVAVSRPEILEPAEWRHVYNRGDVGYWCRPGKTHGISATTNLGGHDRLYVFTSSTPFESEKSYSKFAAYAVLHHGGDFTLAARDVAADGSSQRLVALPAGPAQDDCKSARARIDMRPVLVRLQDVRPEPVMWLWPGRLAAGKLALLVGDPGLGKSWITLDVAARLSAGRAMPDNAPAGPPGDVILLSAEDGLADTIRPRLDALGADVARVHHLAVLQSGDAERAVQLTDIAALDCAIRETGARLIIIDPIAAYLGSTDAHRDAEVRGLMAPLAALAERTDAAILGVMHLAKSTQRPAIYRAVGSIAFAAAARTVLAVAADPERDDRRIVAAVKSNLAASPAALAYTLSDGRLVWAAEPVPQVDVDALLSGPVPDRQERRAADDWLRERLADGPVPVGELQAAARGAGLAWRTIQRAKTRLGVRAALRGYGSAGRWQWHLPETANATDHQSETATPHDVAVSDETAAKLADLSRDRHSADLAVSGDLAVRHDHDWRGAP